jgi:ComF family protein
MVGGTPCLECQDWPEILITARSAVVLEPPADALVHALKYGGWRGLGQSMGRLMARRIPEPFPESVVVPVPTTHERRRARGYNQARVLAEVVAGELSLNLVDALERSRGRTQVSLAPVERRSNVAGAFRPRSAAFSRIQGAEVILVDDVLTTGATGASAAGALAEAGAKSVRLLTFARALPFRMDSGGGQVLQT